MEPLINHERLREISDGDESMALHLVKIFSEDTARQLQNLAAAIQSGNAIEVHRMAHGIAGAAMTYGMTGMVEPLRRLEAEADAGRLDQAQDLLALCRDAFHKIQTLLRNDKKLAA